MNILISGATSMIGCKLANLLSDQDNKVYCLVRKDSKKIIRLNDNNNLFLINCEASNFDNIHKMIDCKIDVGINFYWEGIRGNERNSLVLQENCFRNSVKFIKSAKELGVNKIIGVGSQAEYGAQSLYNENCRCNPETQYGIYKEKTCSFFKKFCNENDIKFLWGRIFSAYGEYDFKNSLIMEAIKLFKNNYDLNLKSGNQIRNYTYDLDLARAFYYMVYDNSNQGIYNITRKDNRKLVDYLFDLKDILKSDSNIIYDQSDNSQILNMKTTSVAFERDFAFKFNYDFYNGILNMLHL